MPRPKSYKKVDPAVRFNKKWKLSTEHFLDGDPCWEWTASKYPGGYGQFAKGGRNIPAHRFAYEHYCEAIPEGLCLDHLCRVRHCVNPMHLEPVTNRENCQRGEGGQHEARKTRCPQGHPYDEANTYTDPNGYRECRTCRRERQKRRAA